MLASFQIPLDIPAVEILSVQNGGKGSLITGSEKHTGLHTLKPGCG